MEFTTTPEATMINVFGLALAALIFTPHNSARTIVIARNDVGVLTATYANGTTTAVKIKLGPKITNANTGAVFALGSVIGPEINCPGTFLIETPEEAGV